MSRKNSSNNFLQASYKNSLWCLSGYNSLLQKNWWKSKFDSNSINKYLTTCHSECINRLQQKNSFKSEFGNPILDFGSACLKKIYLNDFLQITYNNSFSDVFSDKIIVYFRNIGRSPNLLWQFQVSEMIPSLKNFSKDFQTRYKNFFLGTFSNNLIVHYWKLMDVQI